MTDGLPGGFSDVVGLAFTDVDGGFSRCELTVTDEHLNPFGRLHGGVCYTMADTGMGAALYAGLDEDERCATIEVKISYLSSVRSGTVTCETRVLERGRSVAHLESDLTQDGSTVARATGSFSIFSR